MPVQAMASWESRTRSLLHAVGLAVLFELSSVNAMHESADLS